MQTFRILYFRESQLESTEKVRVRDVLEAIDKASRKSPELSAEVWSDKGRVGIIGPTPGH